MLENLLVSGANTDPLKLKYPCPCCGYATYNVPFENDIGYICPICYWENDPFISSLDDPSDCNHGISLDKARSNYLSFGACDERMLLYVRPPREDEKFIKKD